jgi:cytochrome c553
VDGIREIRLAEFAKDNPLVLVAPPRALAASDCSSLSRAREQLARDRMIFVVLVAAIPECALRDGLFLASKPEEVARLFANPSSPDPSWRLTIADTSRIVRVATMVAATQEAAATIINTARAWENGRQSFIGNCGHCHGDDGANTDYVGIKTLTGISRRLSRQEIFDAGQQFGFVETGSWSQRAKDELFLYIQGL